MQVRIEKLLALIPESKLSDLALENGVNHKAKKLQGEVVFKLLLYCLLTQKDCSLHSAASAYESALFKALNTTLSKDSVRFNSISERLSVMKADYFKALYNYCVKTYHQTIGLTGADKFLRFDSTIVTLSAALIDTGYQIKGGDADHLRHLKFTIGLGDIPEAADLYTDKSHGSENRALKESILAHDKNKEEGVSARIHLFDRGISSRLSYEELSGRGICFVSRINGGAKHEVLSANRLSEPLLSGRLLIEEDIDVRMYGSRDSKGTKSYLRLIKARVAAGSKGSTGTGSDKNSVFWFITNARVAEMSAEQLCGAYTRRWEIETFFKFIKQHLNFSHLISRSENGIKIMLYLTMIAAIMVLAYRKLCKMSGFKIVKQQLCQELELEILKTIVAHCGGKPELIYQILKINSS